MKRIKYTYQITEFTGCGEYFTPGMLLLDIETTGLSPENSAIYMFGSAKRLDDEVNVTLLFAENTDQEATIISVFFEELPGADELVTYNGERFDLPFIRERARKYNISTEAMDNLRSVDLLKHIRPFKKLLGLSSCRQKAVEALLGVGREDEYDGGALIEVYHRYRHHPDPDAEHLLVLHNAEDITGMVHILQMLSYSNIRSCHTKLVSAEWDQDEAILSVKLDTDAHLPVSATINENSCYIILEKDRIRAALPVYSGTLKYFFPFPGKYVYLTGEHTVVPKVLASSIPSSEKRPAKACECFTSADGDYIAIDPAVWRKNPSYFEGVRIFKKDYDKKDVLYIKTDRTALEAGSIQSYIGLLIRHYI